MATIKAAEKLSNSNYYVILSLVTLLILGGSIIISRSLFTSVVRGTKVVNAKNEANSQLDKNISAAPQLINAYNGLGGVSSLLADSLPKTADFPGVLVLLENMSAGTGVTLKSVDQATAAAESSSTTSTAPTLVQGVPQKLSLNISVEGSYANLQKFLAAVEVSSRPITINTIQITGTGSDVSVTIDATTYYQAAAGLPITKETIK